MNARLILAGAALLATAAGSSVTPRPRHPEAEFLSGAQTSDRELVRRAVLDYVEGFYEGDSAKLVRSIRPEVYKYGFYVPRDAAGYRGEQMTWPAFLDYARRVKENNRQAPPSAPKEIVLYDVQNQTASAKLTASWGIDYLLLGKFDGRWMVTHVLWQTMPGK